MFTNMVIYMHEIGGVPLEFKSKFKCTDCYYYYENNYCGYSLQKVDNPHTNWCMRYTRVTFTPKNDVK